MGRTNISTVLVLLSCIVSAGCAGTQLNDTPAPESGTLDGSTGTDGHVLSDDRAEEMAIDAEGDYIFGRLTNASCTSKGAPGGHGNVRAEVINRTGSGTYVHVTHPYWYSKGELEADDETESVYFVSSEEVRRESGTDVSPC